MKTFTASDLETRTCPECQRTFRVLEGSSQKFCSVMCSGIRGPIDRRKAFFDCAKNREKRRETYQKFKERKLTNGAGNATKKTTKKSSKEGGSITMQTETQKLDGAKNGPKKTGTVSLPTNENTTPKTEKNSLERSESGATKTTQQEASTALSKDTQGEKFRAQNLIIDSIERLKNLERGMYAGDPDPDIKTLDSYKVRVSIQAYKEIRELIKIGVDLAKTQERIEARQDPIKDIK